MAWGPGSATMQFVCAVAEFREKGIEEQVFSEILIYQFLCNRDHDIQKWYKWYLVCWKQEVECC
jgi:hypothetical protein